MSNITFFIGNGFDLNLGLKTKFSDVINEYLKIKTDDANIKKFQEEFDENYENWSDFEKALGEYTAKFTADNINDLIKQIETFRDVLIRKFKEEEASIDYAKNAGKMISVFFKSLTEFNNYLLDEDKQAISHILSASRGNKDIYYNFVSFNYTNVLDKCVQIVKTNVMSTNSLRKSDYNGQYIVDKIEEVKHIHGTLQNQLILGVDNIDQIANEEFKKDGDFLWKMIKPLTNKELKRTTVKEIEDIIDISSIICVFGMSIGETDKTWWKYIVTWLKVDTSRHLVIFYYNENIDKTNPRTIIENRKNVENIFFSVVEIVQEQERNQLLDRIHIAYNHNMFKMDILSSDNISPNNDIIKIREV